MKAGAWRVAAGTDAEAVDGAGVPAPGGDGVRVHLPPRDAVKPAFPENNIPVFYGCDDNFFAHAMAGVASVLEHASPENNYDFIIVQRGVPVEKLARAAEWVGRRPNASLRFVDITVKMAMADGQRFRVAKHFNLAVYFRIFAPRVFSHYDKIVYLDSDTIVLSDIAMLYRSDMRGGMVLACHDLATECQSRVNPEAARFWREELGKEPGGDYFQSGVMVMDLAAMRREGTEKAFVDKSASGGKFGLPDQDVMNAVLDGRVSFADPAWNLLDWMADEEEESQNYRYLDGNALHTVRSARSRCMVIHFAEKKPWAVDYMGRMGELYWRCAAMTPFFDDSMAALSKQLSPAALLWKRLRFSLQIANNVILAAFRSGEKKSRCLVRAANFSKRRQGLATQSARAAAWKKQYSPTPAAKPQPNNAQSPR